MAGIARVVALGIPHHIAQEGNPRHKTFSWAEDEVKELRRHERSGRPLGREPFVVAVEGQRGRTLRRANPGRSGDGPSK
jgi:hypothetical protein